MKRFRKFMRQCPLAVCILCGWGVLAGGKYLPVLKQHIDQRQMQAELADVREDMINYGAYGGAMVANRAPELSLEKLT